MLTGDVSKRSKVALKWAMMEKVLLQVINLIIGIMLARMLSPEDYGLIGMITVFSGVLVLFNDFGLSAFIIKQKNISKQDCDTIFWTNAFIGFFLSALLFTCRVKISNFYEEPILLKLVPIVSISFLLNSFIIVQEALLRKELNFKKLFFSKLSSILIGGLAALVMAFVDFGVYALANKFWISSVISCFVLWRASSYRPNLYFSSARLKNHLNYAVPLLGAQIISYTKRNYDNLLVSKSLGANAFGHYSRAYQLMMLPVRQITGVFSKVLFPAFSMSADNIYVGKVYVKTIRVISNVTFPLMLLAYYCAESFVYNLLGNQWLELSQIIRILAFAGASQSIGVLVGVIFNYTGNTRILFYMGLISGLVYVIALSFAIKFGLVGVSYAVLFVSLLTVFPQTYLACRQINLSFKTFLRSVLFPYLVSFAIVIFGFFLLEDFIHNKSWYVLVVYPLVILTFYYSVLYIFQKKHFYEIKNLFRDLVMKKKL